MCILCFDQKKDAVLCHHEEVCEMIRVYGGCILRYILFVQVGCKMKEILVNRWIRKVVSTCFIPSFIFFGTVQIA